jgi:hypothetical protein
MSNPKRPLPAIDELRKMVDYFNSQHEGHNAQFSHVELLKIWKFATSEQGGRVHECYDHWPDYLLRAVLALLPSTLDNFFQQLLPDSRL